MNRTIRILYTVTSEHSLETEVPEEVDVTDEEAVEQWVSSLEHVHGLLAEEQVQSWVDDKLLEVDDWELTDEEES